MTQAEYARHRGCADQVVAKAITEGRLSQSVTYGPKGEKIIDPELADKEWAENTGVKGPEPKYTKEELELNKQGVLSLTGTRRIKEHLAAQKLQQDMDIRAKKLIHIDDLNPIIANFVLTSRNAILAIPDRLAPLVAANTDVAECHKLITDELEKALENLANVPKLS